MSLALEFRFSRTSCNNEGSPSRIQALEFSASRWHGSKRAELAAQYEVVGDGAPQWRIWDGRGWTALDPPITNCLGSDRWHRFALSGRLARGLVRYDKLTVDGQQHQLSRSFSQVRDSSRTRLAVAVQADGNATSTPYRFWIDRVRLAIGR